MGALGTSLIAWVLFPAVLYVLALGLGLLTERVTGFEMQNALLVPLGFCVAVTLTYPVYRMGAGVTVAAPLLAIPAVVGLVAARADFLSRVNPGKWPAAGAIAAFVLCLAPVVLAGGWTWTGYNFVNDTATQLLLADHVAETGLSNPAAAPGAEPFSTSTEHVRVYLETAYPVGSHGLLAAAAVFIGAPVEAVYSPFLAAMMAFFVMALFGLLRRSGLSAPVAAGTAFMAVAANLTYNYVLQGNIKEVAFLAALGTAVAIGREGLGHARPAAGVACLGLCVAAMLNVYSAAAVPYAGMLAVFLLAAVFFMPAASLRRRLLPAAALGIAVTFVASLPALTKIVRFGEAAQGTFDSSQASGVDAFGHLLRPLELVQTLGVWLADDYRLPVAPESRETVTTVLIVIGVLLAAAGLAWVLRKREFGPLLYFGPAAVTLAVLAPRVSPYADAKMLAILSPAGLLLAGFGAAAIARVWRLAAYALATVFAAGVLLSDAYTYHSVQLAPTERMEAMEELAHRYSDVDDLILVNESEEFAKYFMRDARVNVSTEAITPRQIELREPRAFPGYYFDLDEQLLEYVMAFDRIVMRRSPAASRPPVGYALDWTNEYYEVWRRAGGVTARAHLPLQAPHELAVVPDCRELRTFAEQARPGEWLVAADPRPAPELDLADVSRPPSWLPHPYVPNQFIPHAPGKAAIELELPGGQYQAWVNGSFGRPVAVDIGGQEVGSVSGVDSPDQWSKAALVTLEAGAHRFALRRGGGTLKPGDGYKGAIGPLTLERVDLEARLRWFRPRQWQRLCGQRWDWIERVRR